MLNLRRTLTSINPYEVQTLSGRLLNRQCLNQKVKAVAQQLVWNSQLQDCNAFRNCWQFYANGQKPVSFVEQQRRKMANRGFVDRIKNPNAAKFLQLFATSELRVQGNVYDQMYDEFVSCFKCPQSGPCTTKKSKRHLSRKSVKVVTAARPATRNEGKKLKPIFKINPALLPHPSNETAPDKRRIRFKDDNIRTKPGIIYKSWISTVGTSADASRDDSLEMETIEIPHEEFKKNEKPEVPKTDAKPDELQQNVKNEGLKAKVRLAKLQQSVKPQGLKANVRPEELPKRVKPEGLRANVRTEQLQSNVKPQKLIANVVPEELLQSVKPENLQANVRIAESQPNVKPQGLKRNVKPKQLKHKVKNVQSKHYVSFKKKLSESLIPKLPKLLEPTRNSNVTNISEKDITSILEKEDQRTQKEIELAEIAMLEELARKRRIRLTKAHSEPNFKSHSFKHHKHHAQRKKTYTSLRRTDTLNMSRLGSSLRSTYTRNMLNIQKQSRFQDLLKFRLSTTPIRYSSQSLASRKSYGRGSTMSRPSVRYRGSAMTTSPRPAPPPTVAPGPAHTSTVAPGPTNAAEPASKPPTNPLPLPLPIVHGPIKKKKQGYSIPSIKPTIYITKKISKVKESSLDTLLKPKYASLYLKKFGSDPLPVDMTSVTSIDSPAKPVDNDWGFMKLPKLPSGIFWKLSSSFYEPSYEIFENFLNKYPPIDVEQHVQDFMTNNNINFDMFDTLPRNWPLPFESKLVRRMRSEKRKCLTLPKTSRKTKKTEKTRRKKVSQEPKPEPELHKVPSCEICRNFNQTEPDQPYMIEMKKRQACDELKRYYRQRLMSQPPNSPTVRCAAPKNPCVHFGSQPELNIMEEKLRQVRDELKRYRRRSPTDSQSVQGSAPDEPFICFGSRPEPNMIEMRKQEVRDELKTHYFRRLSTSSSQMASDYSTQKPCVHFDDQTEPSSRHKQDESLRPSQVHLNWQPKQIRMHKEKHTMRQKLAVCYKMLCDCETLLDKKLKQLKDDKRCL